MSRQVASKRSNFSRGQIDEQPFGQDEDLFRTERDAFEQRSSFAAVREIERNALEDADRPFAREQVGLVREQIRKIDFYPRE